MIMSRILTYVAVPVICIGVMMAACSPGSQEKLPKRYTETVTTKDGEQLGFEMVLIPGGSFMMGSSEDQQGRVENEGPQHKVRLDSFYLCTTEATVELFAAYYQETVSAKEDFLETEQTEKPADGEDVDAITGPTPVYGDMTMGYSNKHPAMGMTWHNATTFCRWLSKKTGKKYRLPTEAEWEYACRAGSDHVFGFGNSAGRLTADPNQLKDYAWYKENADFELHEVAGKKPNAYGLYDILGNVQEWVYDFYSPTTYKQLAEAGPILNPTGPKTGDVHAARGGYHSSPAEELRCAYRCFEEDWWRMNDPQIPKSIWWLPDMDIVGLRVACSVDKDKKK